MENYNMGGMTTSPSLTPQMMSANPNDMASKAGSTMPLSKQPSASGDNGQHSMHELCKKHMNQFVQLTTNDNMSFMGIITDVDDENVHLAVPNWGSTMSGYPSDHMTWTMPCGCSNRSYYGGFQGSPYGMHYSRSPYYAYNRGFSHQGHQGFHGHQGHHRPFNRLVFPLAILIALSRLPWY